jgi:arylsulfatase B
MVSVLLFPAVAAGVEECETKPNILLIFVDDLGYGELGCQGNPEIPTPHIDSLAENGVRCTAGYVTASYCSPSRAGILTGRYQTRFGHELNPVGRHNLHPQAGLPLSEITLAGHLKKAGYRTGLVGKWHLGGAEKFHPSRHGFEEFFGFLHEGHFYVPPPYRGVTSFLRKGKLPPESGGRKVEGNTIWSTHLPYDEPPYDENNPLLRGAQPIEEESYLTDALTREAVAFIEKHKGKPFFLYLSYNAVHSPMQGADEYMRRFERIEDIHRRVFAAMLSNMDDSIGSVLRMLRECKLEEKTLIFFISDNGGPTRELTSSNRPLRGGKGSLYEGGIRIPFIVQWKGKLPAGKVYAHPVISVDVFTTASAAARMALPKDRKMDGVNLLDYLSGQRSGPPHTCLFWRMGHRGALRKGEWKLVRELPRGGTPRAGGKPRVELFHLMDDLGETENLATGNPEKLSELLDTWERISSEMADPVWRPR